MNELKGKVVNITPDLARKWLLNNKVNRTLSVGRMSQYAYDMKHGKWQVNGEAIKFGKDGSLKDGQHRLFAIIKANVTVSSLVIYGLDENITIQDRGRNRSVTDSLLLEGMNKKVANSRSVAIAKLHYYMQNSSNNISDYQVKEFIIEHQKSLEKVSKMTVQSGKYKGLRIPIQSASIGLALMTALEVGYPEDELRRWCDIVKTGIQENVNEAAASIFRNDMMAKNIGGGTQTMRKKAVYQTEKSISDFHDKYKRKVSYINIDSPVYSNYKTKED